MSHQVDVDADPAVVAEPVTVRPRHSLLLGLCGLFAVWVLVMPPFAGSDEFDHAYRAAAAARGQWAIDPVDATRGTGAFLNVPADIVEAAQSECQHLRYTKDGDCIGTADGDDRVVASGAGRYHPLFYGVIGTAAKPFHGTAALYVMRITTALLAAAFVWLAALAVSTWARSRWPYLGIAVACTPVALYSSSLAAPNGVEMMSALALWMSLIGLLVASREHIPRLAGLAGVSGAVLATLRPLGPLWCLLLFAAVLVAVRAEAGRIRHLLRRRSVLLAAALVFLSALQSAAWVIWAQALRLGVEDEIHTTLGHRIGASATQLPAWVFQAIAAFPLRDDASHPAVYACYLILFGILMVLGIGAGSVRSRVAIVLIGIAVLLFPYVTTVKSWDMYRAAWQGRYGLPLAIGMVVLATYALDRSGRDLRGPMRVVLFGLFVVAQTVAPAYTLMLEVRHSPQVDSSAWVQPSMLVTVVLAGAFSALMWWGAFGRDLPGRDRVRAPA